MIVTARDEQQRIGATLDALSSAFPATPIVVADDGSRDRTAAIARHHGAAVIVAACGRGRGARRGKGAAATRAAAATLAELGPGAEHEIVLLCDADLGASAGRLGALVDAVARGEGDLAVAAFSRRAGGGVGAAIGFARWAARRDTGLRLRAPISGQRALRATRWRRCCRSRPGSGWSSA